MIVCAVCYAIAGFTANPWISLAVGVVLIVIGATVLNKVQGIATLKKKGSVKA